MKEKPHYACSSKDCNLRFSNEIYLQMHKKKHEMVLSLGKTNMTASDQTPTPTTFIRNCEEVGLFQDLRNVNPFEETFRKAAEAVKTGGVPPSSLSFSPHGADDTLHTPHVFPNIAEGENVEKSQDFNAADNARKSVSDKGKVVKSEADTSLKITSPNSVIHHEIVSNLSGSELMVDKTRQTNKSSIPVSTVNDILLNQQNAKQDQNVQVLLKMPDGTFLELSTRPVEVHQTTVPQIVAAPPILNQIIAPSLNNTVILNTHSLMTQHSRQNNTPTVKEKLKQALLNGLKAPVKTPNKVPINGSLPAPIQLVKQAENRVKRLETALIRRASSSTNSEEDANEEKRRKALERNRAAAMRCREKRKAWVTELRKKAELMAAANQNLHQEVAFLRSEVARLKALLLTHKNCPVTLAAIASGEVERVTTVSEEESLNNKGPVMVVISKKIDPVVQSSAGGPYTPRGPITTQVASMVESVAEAPSTRNAEDSVTVTAVTVESDVTIVGGQGGKGSAGIGSRMRERLSLDIENARRLCTASVIDLDSPLVRSDEVLSSVAPTTPNEADKLVSFTDDHMEIDASENSEMDGYEERPLATPVIRLNPNAVLRSSSSSTKVTYPSTTNYR